MRIYIFFKNSFEFTLISFLKKDFKTIKKYFNCSIKSLDIKKLKFLF